MDVEGAESAQQDGELWHVEYKDRDERWKGVWWRLGF
jgi:hypothetical protein